MRMWMVDPRVLCRKHLLGEHVETHMFAGTLAKGVSLRGYIEKGLVEVHNIRARHDALAKEMIRREMNHQSPMGDVKDYIEGTVDVKESLRDLKTRCWECHKRMKALESGKEL